MPWLTPNRVLSPSHNRPRPLCGSLPSTTCLCILTLRYPVTHSPNGSCYFKPNFSRIFLIPSSFYSHLPAYEDGTECSETSAYKLQTPGKYPKGSIRQFWFCWIFWMAEVVTLYPCSFSTNERSLGIDMVLFFIWVMTDVVMVLLCLFKVNTNEVWYCCICLIAIPAVMVL